MSRWVWILLGTLLICVVLGVGGGLAGLRYLRNEMSEPIESSIAESVEAAVVESISRQQSISPADSIVISDSDLNINTEVGYFGESGFEVYVGQGEDNVMIYGALTEIDSTGVHVLLADAEYWASPVVRDGKIEFDDRKYVKGATGWMIPAATFESGFESGINDAFHQHQLVPVTVTLESGQMVIETSPLV